ncbi:MAG: chloride channel protein, partial [Lachnospiraceae bacterium]|nr:chloride channel protein [Lachnospiraceae bacterium]
MVNYTGQLKSAIKWVLFAILLGVILGFVGALFFKLTGLAGSFRELHPWMIFLLPGAGLLIAVLYYHIGDIKDPGTNLVFESVRAKEKLPPQMAPLIFVCTVITHLFGGSAGREGAALQIGGSIATTISDLLHLAEKDRDIII